MTSLSGKTLLGFIIGLLVGLAVALGVAVYVTKVPIPLVDRGVQRSPEQEAIEAERNRHWNPNASLSGTTANKPVPATTEEKPPETHSAAPAPVAASADTGRAAAPAATAPSTDPLGDLIQGRTIDSARVTEVTADPFVYYVQVGAYRAANDAETQRARLTMLGLDARVSEKDQAGKPVFRVRLGPFDKKVEAETMQSRVSAQGIDAALVRVQR